MRLLNIGVDTLYIKGRNVEEVEYKGGDKCDFELILGEPLYDVVNKNEITQTIPNYVKFGGKEGFSVWEDKKLENSNYILTKIHDEIPLILDRGTKVVGDFHLVYTSVYNLDFTSVVNNIKFYAKEEKDFKRIKILAGGYDNLSSERVMSLIMLVPKDVKFINHGEVKETLKDKLIKKLYKTNCKTIQEILQINDYEIMT